MARDRPQFDAGLKDLTNIQEVQSERSRRMATVRLGYDSFDNQYRLYAKHKHERRTATSVMMAANAMRVKRNNTTFANLVLKRFTLEEEFCRTDLPTEW